VDPRRFVQIIAVTRGMVHDTLNLAAGTVVEFARYMVRHK
jgi:hypothetical protein